MQGKVLCTLLLLFLTACGSEKAEITETTEPPMPGMQIEKTDATAPKEIASRDITEFSVSFLYYGKADPAQNGIYYFTVKPAGEDFTLTSNGCIPGEMTINAEAMESLQTVIERFNLVKLNGVDSVTTGLPAEFAPWTLWAAYASGETLYFNVDGHPDAVNADGTRAMQWTDGMQAWLAAQFGVINEDTDAAGNTEQAAEKIICPGCMSYVELQSFCPECGRKLQ